MSAYGIMIAAKIFRHEYMELNLLLMWRGKEPLTHKQGEYMLKRLHTEEKKKLHKAFLKYFEPLRTK
jgi:hypothetical protein